MPVIAAPSGVNVNRWPELFVSVMVRWSVSHGPADSIGRVENGTAEVRLKPGAMEQRTLGSNGPAVSAMGLGCWGMSGPYGPSDDAEAARTFDRALELGITFIDTADTYGSGHNEELVGRMLRGRR